MPTDCNIIFYLKKNQYINVCIYYLLSIPTVTLVNKKPILLSLSLQSAKVIVLKGEHGRPVLITRQFIFLLLYYV